MNFRFDKDIKPLKISRRTSTDRFEISIKFTWGFTRKSIAEANRIGLLQSLCSGPASSVQYDENKLSVVFIDPQSGEITLAESLHWLNDCPDNAEWRL